MNNALNGLSDALRIVRAVLPPTPQQRWPLLGQRLRAAARVKHENPTRVSAFKVRGGLVYFDALRLREPECKGVARAHTDVTTRIVGVVSAHALAYQLSFRAGRVVEAPVTTELADGLACRSPDAQALAVMLREVDDVLAVTDTEVAAAMRALFADTHNVAEGAGAAALAAALQQRMQWQGRSIGLALTGGNVDSAVFARVLSGT